MERMEAFLETFLRKLAPNESQVGQAVNGPASNGHLSNHQDLNGHGFSHQALNGHTSNGHVSSHQASNGHASNHQASNGHASNGQTQNGQTANGTKIAPEAYRRPQAYSPVPPARHKQHQLWFVRKFIHGKRKNIFVLDPKNAPICFHNILYMWVRIAFAEIVVQLQLYLPCFTFSSGPTAKQLWYCLGTYDQHI